MDKSTISDHHDDDDDVIDVEMQQVQPVPKAVKRKSSKLKVINLFKLFSYLLS